jgi:hypothetical protein
LLSFKDKNILHLKTQELEQIQTFEKKLASPFKRKSNAENIMLMNIFPSIKEEYTIEHETSPPQDYPNINFTNLAKSKISQIVENKEISISQSQKDKKKDVIAKFFVATSNPKIIKKLFLYQLKKTLLHAKKDLYIKSTYSISDSNSMSPFTRHSQSTVLSSYEIFSNFSQINYCFIDNVIKYDYQNIKINNYMLYKNIILGKGSFSTVFLSKHVNTNKDFVDYLNTGYQSY